jgi:uncharacterized protein YprB with RNaseH-like and TPR domain
MVEELAPDVVVATPPAPNAVAGVVRRGVSTPILTPGRGTRPDAAATEDGSFVIAALPGDEATLSPAAIEDALDDDTPFGAAVPMQTGSRRVCLTDTVSLSVDPYERSAQLEGVDTYRQRLPSAWRDSSTTHLSTSLRSGFERTVPGTVADELQFIGIGESQARLGAGVDTTNDEVAMVDLYENGAYSIELVEPDSFGLRTVDGVGKKTAKRLRRAGYHSPEDLLEARVTDLTQVQRIGKSKASTIRSAAKAVARGTVVATDNGSLPGGDPIFIDIETDGIEASTAWLIGVLDGGPQEGDYLAFREQHPGDSGHLEAFMTWLSGNGADRPVVAWNGYGFDFPVIKAQLREHCPSYVADWADAFQFDPLYWARNPPNGKGNAVLPGRSNKLEHVAEALGWEPQTNGIDGGTVAELYVAYRNGLREADDMDAVAEPDWTRLETYCEDDVRALATIYDALKDAARYAPGTTGTDSGSESGSGTQGSLSDFT